MFIVTTLIKVRRNLNSGDPGQMWLCLVYRPKMQPHRINIDKLLFTRMF